MLFCSLLPSSSHSSGFSKQPAAGLHLRLARITSPLRLSHDHTSRRVREAAAFFQGGLIAKLPLKDKAALVPLPATAGLRPAHFPLSAPRWVAAGWGAQLEGPWAVAWLPAEDHRNTLAADADAAETSARTHLPI